MHSQPTSLGMIDFWVHWPGAVSPPHGESERGYTFHKIIFVFVTVLLCFSFGCSETDTSKPETNERDRYWKKVKELYQKAKESGEKVPENITDWVTEDIKKIGTWEYKIVHLDVEDESAWVVELNKMGNKRWECFWVEKKNKRLLLFFKRPRKSYLKAIPMREILKFIPQGDSQ